MEISDKEANDVWSLLPLVICFFFFPRPFEGHGRVQGKGREEGTGF